MSLYDPNDDDEEPTKGEKMFIQFIGFLFGIWLIVWSLYQEGCLG